MGGSVSVVDGHIDGDELIPYKKKAKKNTPAKAKHKHVFMPCVLEYEGIALDKAHGFIPKPEARIAGYCPVCGKIGDIDFRTWYTSYARYPGLGIELTPAAKRELDPATRTLPTFHAKDGHFSKFVELEEV